MSNVMKRGWHWDMHNSRLDVYVDNTEVAYFDDSSPYLTIASGLTITAGGATITAGGLTITAGGLTVTAGGATITAGGLTVTAGGIVCATGYNISAGTAATFGTTAGTNAVKFLAGTAPDGTATNTCQLYSDNSGDDLSVEHADGSEDELTT